MNLDEAVILVRSLKGAPISILVMLMLKRRPLGAKQLAHLTGYHINTVEAGLATLGEMGLAIRTGRYQSWQLTDKGYQLPLFDQDDYPTEEPVESEKFRLAPGGERDDPEFTPRFGVIESENLRFAGDEPPQEDARFGAIESEKFRLDGGEAVGDPVTPTIESEKFRLDPPAAGLGDQNLNTESEKFRLAADMHVLKHVVVLNNKDSPLSDKQQHEQHDSGEGAREDPEELERVIQAMVEIFVTGSVSQAQARKTAEDLVTQFGLKRCQDQLEYFPRRCEVAKKSVRGLENPSGLFIKSVKNNYAPLPKAAAHGTWYDQDEFDDLIEH